MRPLRFCMITTFYPPYHFGGDAIGIQRLSRGLAARGHEVTIVHDRDTWRLLSGREDPPEPEPEPGIAIVGLESRFPRLNTLAIQQSGRPLAYGRALRKVLDAGRFDVINFHNVSQVGGPGLFHLGDAIKLYMAHEHWLVCPSHVLWRHGRERCTERECLRCVLKHRRPPQLWRSTGFLDREARHVDAFIAMSEFSRAKHAEFGFRHPMEVLPYFLPELPEEEAAGERPQERPYFLFVGRLEKIKGLDDVIPAFRDREGAELLIAGEGNHGDELRRIADGSPRVRFLGRLDPEELSRYYRHALALIVPSVCFETFGIILIEAFRSGLPVVARRLGPFPEIVERSEAGELFETHEELMAALDRLEADEERRVGMGEAGRAAWRRYWSEEAVIPQYLDIVKRAAEKRGASEVLEAVKRT